MTKFAGMPSYISSSWTRIVVIAYFLVIFIVVVAHCEHNIDLGHASSDDVLIPTNNGLYSSGYLVPFRAVDTARYLSTLKRHKRSVWLVPTTASVGKGDVLLQNGRHHRGYRAHQPDYLQLTFM